MKTPIAGGGAALTLMMIALCQAGVAEAGVGRFLFVTGDVRVQSSDGSQRPAQKGLEIEQGDTLIAGRPALAQISMADGGTLVLRPETRLVVSQFNYPGRSDGSERATFDLEHGSVRAITGDIGRVNKQNYMIRTPTANIGVRGTDHEPAYVPPPEGGAVSSTPPGTYDKVNVGSTFIENKTGRVVILAGAIGFAGDAASPPGLLTTPPEFYRKVTPTATRRPTGDAATAAAEAPATPGGPDAQSGAAGQPSAADAGNSSSPSTGVAAVGSQGNSLPPGVIALGVQFNGSGALLGPGSVPNLGISDVQLSAASNGGAAAGGNAGGGTGGGGATGGGTGGGGTTGGGTNGGTGGGGTTGGGTGGGGTAGGGTGGGTNGGTGGGGTTGGGTGGGGTAGGGTGGGGTAGGGTGGGGTTGGGTGGGGTAGGGVIPGVLANTTAGVSGYMQSVADGATSLRLGEQAAFPVFSTPVESGGDSDLNVTWGRWAGGYRIGGVDVVVGLHRIGSTSALSLDDLQKMSGRFQSEATYNYVAGPAVTSQTGATGTINTLSARIDFDHLNVSQYTLAMSFPDGATWNASGSGSLQKFMGNTGIGLQGTFVGAGVPTPQAASGSASGALLGNQAQGLMTAFGLQSGRNGVVGVGLLKR